MTLQKIASELAKREGKKSQVRIGDIREILRLLIEYESDCCYVEESPCEFLTRKSIEHFRKMKIKADKKKGAGIK